MILIGDDLILFVQSVCKKYYTYYNQKDHLVGKKKESLYNNLTNTRIHDFFWEWCEYLKQNTNLIIVINVLENCVLL